jgi:hypothetical protein
MSAARHAAAKAGSTARTALWIGLFALLVYCASGGGRVVGSDEVTMLELSRGMLQGHVWVPTGATLRGPDGREYTKNAAAQAVLALPLVAVSEAGARAAGLDPARARLAVRFGASFFNALVTALMLAACYAAARALGASRRAALLATLLLGFATPTWVYAKSFMAEPLEALGLLLALHGASLAGTTPRPRGPRPEHLAALGACVAISAKLSMLPLACACLLPGIAAPRRAWVWPLVGIAAALAGHAAYDVARFGTPFETGYGAQATPAAYTTPLLVGLYGLLLSSGKGLAWFAPAAWLVPAAWRELLRDGRRGEGVLARFGLGTPRGRAAWGAIAASIVALLLYARFQHWAGDGSYGPRYLVPLLPLLLVCVAPWLAPLRKAIPRGRARLALVLLAIGVCVQVGGVAIYFGAQMREAGDYPYTLPLDHPRFMSDSHFNPRFSPIAGHWRMLARNVGEHLRGEAPRLAVGGDGGGAARDARTGLSADEERSLLHGLDFWWLYLGYAGVGGRAPMFAALLLIALAVAAAFRLRVALAAEPEAP